MRHCRMILMLWGILFATAVSAADNSTASDKGLPPRDQFHLYLLIGQSNMAGRGKMTAADKQSHPRVLKLDRENHWVPGADPLHFDKPTIAGVGPGSGFGRAMADADDQVTIGLIPSAVGGTPLRRWQPDGDLYQAALKRAHAAMQAGVLKGIIWHQGEADAGKLETANTYQERLLTTFNQLRKDLNTPDVPIVVGKLGEFIPETRIAYLKTVNAALASIPEKLPNSACVEATDLKAKSDGIHFDADSAREFGRRYAQAMQKLQSSLVAP